MIENGICKIYYHTPIILYIKILLKKTIIRRGKKPNVINLYIYIYIYLKIKKNKNKKNKKK